ncbi:ORF6C domain-containing protein [Pueribacillus sp. YX66]|uniref:ORF6C domain-containing protein n=1 Tax=Pueribacillus sp. YX66 TaxID=3229242 RepID=UPI00358D97C0
MNQLKVISQNGQLVTESRDVAKMIGKNHADLLRDIRSYVKVLGKSNFAVADFFIKSSYKDAQNKVRPCYQITKKGCEMVANKLTGEKGVLFTAAYVSKFNEMENQLKPSNTKLLLQTALEHEEKIEKHGERIAYLEENMRIDGGQEFQIRKKANHVVVEALGGKEAPAYEQLSRKAFSEFWRDFKDHFNLPRYGDLPKKQFEEGLRFIGMWQPSTGLRIEIESVNTQQQMRVV